jgi:methionyl-tRNA formyltransferase
MKIIFMGTPEFAATSLKALIDQQYDIVAVVTAPDKPAGRGGNAQKLPVKDLALQHNIPVLQPTNLKATDFLDTLKSYGAALQIVVAFRMLPELVWAMPPLGTFNLHASLLPQYRGAAPINWAIINGETQTGLTTFFLKQEIDTGDVILQEKETILPTDNAGSLYERLMHKGANLIISTVELIKQGNYTLRNQEKMGEVNHAPKIFKETCQLDFTKTSLALHNFVRGLSPYPAAWLLLDGKHCKVFETSIIANKPTTTSTTYLTDGKTYLHFATADGWLAIENLQIEGKKRMSIEEFLRGYKFTK